jgi:hypothetical protein
MSACMVQPACSLTSTLATQLLCIYQGFRAVQVQCNEGVWDLAACDSLSVSEAKLRPACQLEVIYQGPYIGFRSPFAEGRMLQVSRRHRRLVLSSHTFGVYEQMSVVKVRSGLVSPSPWVHCCIYTCSVEGPVVCWGGRLCPSARKHRDSNPVRSPKSTTIVT